MPSILQETHEQSGNLKYPSPGLPFYSFQAPYYGVSNQKEVPPPSSVSKISPLILLVIVVLAVIFFVYGIVHLVLWFLMKMPSSSSSLFLSNRFPETTRSRALQRQLQQLFRLHDSGLDQSTMDSLPVFYYKDVMNLKEPFDCAVCLCEFSDDDKLRLLPICGHAFHIHCIDTWLLSNSTCPLCRATLSSSGFSIENPISNNSRVLSSRVNSDEEDNGCWDYERPVSGEEHDEEKRVVSVRLGKFKNINGIMGGENRREEETGSSCSLDARRCYSMGSYQYVEGNSYLQVVLSGKSEESDLKRESASDVGEEGKKIGGRSRDESFSVSKIWLWSKKSQFRSSSSVALSSLQ